MNTITHSYNTPSNMKRRHTFGRIPRRHTSSTPMNQVEVRGDAYICFAQDFSWFQGNINTDDESNYSIYGEQVLPTNNMGHDSIYSSPHESEDEESLSSSCSISDKDSLDSEEPQARTSPLRFKATLTDHFTGLRHQLPQLTLATNPKDIRGCNESVFDCREGHMDFTVSNVFKGQKADMVIQRSLGSPALLGKGCLVFSGLMDIDFSEVIDYGKSWSL